MHMDIFLRVKNKWFGLLGRAEKQQSGFVGQDPKIGKFKKLKFSFFP